MSLAKVWNEVQSYLKEKVSIIPVRDKQEGDFAPKTPYFGWKKYQTELITEELLFKQMEKVGTSAVAIVGGKISGNLEIIDIDNKNWEGIETFVFQQIAELFPDIWKKIRIHKSPSGGYHILYRVYDGEVTGSKKLCYKKDVKEAAIETRGEGGYALCPPSLNYSVYKDNPIPYISWSERCAIISICESFNENIKVEKIKHSFDQSKNIYDENPFEHFNKSDNGKVLSENGWKVLKENNRFIWYTRPGKDKGISASFNKATGMYYIFTSSTEFDNQKGYFPASVLATYQFKGDYKRVYSHLVSNGYGKINYNKEQKLAKERATKNLEPLPNFSKEAINTFENQKQVEKQKYPYGVYIKYNEEKESYSISREALYNVSEKLGFYILDNKVLQVRGKFVYKCTDREFFDAVKSYINEEDPDIFEEHCNIFESFIQSSGEFTIKRLPLFDKSLVLKDDKFTAYLFYTNTYLKINKDQVVALTYEALDKLVFADTILPREFNTIDDYGTWGDFVEKTVGISDYSLSIFGFMCHKYKDETTGYIPVLTEECEDPMDGGGAGKNVFCNMLKYVTSYVNKNCANPKFDERFFQIWNGQRVLCLSDLPKSFDFDFLKEAATGSIIHKLLFKDEVEVMVEDTPKIICQTNFSIDSFNGGIKRRIRQLEFSDFFTKRKGVDVHYKKHFPNDFDQADWAGFDMFVIKSLQVYIAQNLKILEQPISDSGWRKQFKQKFSHNLLDFIESNIDNWKEIGNVENNNFNQTLNEFYRENNIPDKYKPSTIKINDALDEYCSHHSIPFVKSTVSKLNGISSRGRKFGEKEEVF